MSTTPPPDPAGDAAPAAPHTLNASRRNVVLTRFSELGASAQAAIPGLYAWAITVAPAAWSRGAPLIAKIAAVIGVVALVTAPLVEGAGLRAPPPVPASPPGGERVSQAPPPPRGLGALRGWTGPTWARIWSVWGFVLSSAIVWTLAPGALSSARLDGVRGALGVVGWGLFAFASAGPSLRADANASSRIVAGSALKPRSELPRGDGAYVAAGVLLALGMQSVGWSVASPERAVLVRLVTVVCGVAVLGATTSIALARHQTRTLATGKQRLRRGLPWVVILALCLGSGLLVTFR